MLEMYYTFHSSLGWNESHGAAAPHLLIKPAPCQAVADVQRVKITAQTSFHHSFLQPLTAGGDITSSHQKTCLSSGIYYFFKTDLTFCRIPELMLFVWVFF